MANCVRCNKKFGLLEIKRFINPLGNQAYCVSCYEIIQKQEGEEEEECNQAISTVILTTGDIKHPYEILDVIVTVAAHQAGYFDAANPSSAFGGIKMALRKIAYDMGANTVIHCQFEYRVGAGQGLLSRYLGGKQFVEIFAYGTAVKLKSEDA